MNAKEFMSTQKSVEDKLDKLKVHVIEDALTVSAYRGNNVDDEKNLKCLSESISMLEEYCNVEPIDTAPDHYKGQVDVISFLDQQFTEQGFIDAMVFNIVKYTTRLGRKDSIDKEVSKIRTYYNRLYKYLLYGESNFEI